MAYFKKGTLVFVHTESYPPWPAQIQRKYDNGLYKVNFIGQKSYTRIQEDKMDLFNEERAKQIHSELQDKKLSKAIFVALKQFENRKKRGQIDPDLAQALKKNLAPLDLSMYKSSLNHQPLYNAKAHTTQYSIQNFAKFLPSNSTEDNLQEIGRILDRIYDFIILPVQEKLPQYLQQSVYNEKKLRMQQQTYKLKQLLLKQEENVKPGSSKEVVGVSEKQQYGKNSSSSNSLQIHPTNTKKSHPSAIIAKTSFMQKLMDTKIIEKLIMTIKAYECFREESEKQFEEIINFIKEKFNLFYDKFREEYNKKKLPSQKDRIMLEKFQDFRAYL